MVYRYFLGVLLLAVVVMHACAGGERRSALSDEETLRERIAAYWDYKIAGQFDKSYEFEDPLFRKGTSLVSYIRRAPSSEKASWAGARVETLRIEGDTASVDMKIRLRIRTGQPSGPFEPEVSFTERWIRVDGVWYHVYKS